MTTANPINAFLKYARETKVRSYTKTVGGRRVHVEAHDRSVEDKEPSPPTLPQDLTSKKTQELELWRAWKDGGMQANDLRPLLRSFRPMIRSKVNVYKGKVKLIPDSAIESEFQLRFVDALRSYNPDKGSLGTYVYRYLDKAKRFIVENQNVGRIPENRIYKIKKFTNARDELVEELGRPPTTKELASRLSWSLAESDRMESELRNDLVSQGFEEDPYIFSPSKSEEVLRLFKYELTGSERAVYEHLTGLGRKQITSTGEIGKALKMPDYRVSRLKTAIQKKLKRYLQ
jgi:DNA-directed RNA polymerase specialized sigma subunit